jgi:L-seryl-tRNA(Ser) seleniumtransferase
MNPSSARGGSSDLLRQLPSVHDLLSTEALSEAAVQIGRSLTREAARVCLERWRARLCNGLVTQAAPTLESLVREVLCLLDERRQTTIRRVINATGVLLHTGLGRAPLSQEAVDAVLQATGYCNIEMDLHTGKRTRRHEVVQADLCALTGAEAAMVVNNNAGATGLVLATFAAGRELIVSHGQLVEIGGGFRLPDVFRAYGVQLRAVGTTNRTRVEDYEAAINERTGAIMVIHASNYRVIGFTQQAKLRDLVDLARDRDFPLIHDLGSGALVDFLATDENSDPLVRDSVDQGAGLVLFSGDKLLGGPQAGVIVGKRHLVEQLVQHPMSRALRIDKLTLAALQATLAIYRRGEADASAYDAIPFLRMLRTPNHQLEHRARTLANRLSQDAKNWKVGPVQSEAYAGGGSLPGNKLESWAVVIKPANPDADVELLAQNLRTTHPAVLGRIHRGELYFDLRGVDPSDDESLFVALASNTVTTTTGT